jgi:hypothetical protein
MFVTGEAAELLKVVRGGVTSFAPVPLAAVRSGEDREE